MIVPREREGKSMKTNLPDFDALWNYDDPAASEQAFRALLPLAEASGDRNYQVELMTQIARAEGLQRKFEQAHATLNTARAIQHDRPRPLVRHMLERGRVFNSAGQVEHAQQMFEQAWDAATHSREDFYAIDAAHMLALVASNDEQLEWNLKALALAEASEQPRAKRWFGSLRNNIGRTYHDRGHYAQALDMFEQALRAREETGDARQIRIARWCVARALRSLGRVEEALEMQRRLSDEFGAAGETDGYVHEERAECLRALGRHDEARAQFALAYAALSQDAWLAESEPERIARLKELGGVRS
jgi:tetratricopeptide (TPR) repeat protein